MSLGLNEIEKLEGRELDVLVAEHVMGWTNVRQADEGPWVGHSPTESQANVLTVIPHYSTNIADAWQVIEHLAAWKFEIHRREKMPGEVEYKADIYLRSSTISACWNGGEIVYAATAPLAICRGALASVLSVRGEGGA